MKTNVERMLLRPPEILPSSIQTRVRNLWTFAAGRQLSTFEDERLSGLWDGSLKNM
jgi:hypothetical protein